MLTDVSAIRTYFSKLGLEPAIADLYLALHSHGPQTISELARTSRVERTRIYRLIDALMESNLVEVETRNKRGFVKAAPIANLHILITQKEQELRSLQDELGLIEQVLARNSLSNAASRVHLYQSPQGIRQMLWNELDTKGEILGYQYRVPEESTGKKYLERWNEEFTRRKLHSRLLTGADFAASWRTAAKTAGISKRPENVAYHTIQPDVFKISHSCSLYNDVLAYTHWVDGEVYGLEIHNQALADSQRQLFELLWTQSAPGLPFNS